MKCTECGGTLTKSVGDHLYVESGLDNVILRNVTKYECESCGAKSVSIERMAQLHRLLAHIIATKPARLVPAEVRFIRDHLELSNKDFATLMGVTEGQASRWTSSEPIGVPAERFLRMIATLGPIVISADTLGVSKAEIRKPKESELLEDVRATLRALPSKDEPVKEVPVRVRRTANDWKPEQVASA
jgi:putative zinc finger/helix-turn-helix YgiT family protein